MKFSIITHVIHKKKQDSFFAYEPYVNEMNIWLNYVSELKIVAPYTSNLPSNIDIKYKKSKILFSKIHAIDILTFKNTFITFLRVPLILTKIFKAMVWADHIHLRCPGNIGLLACFVQILFPKKIKTIKYAGNWDPNSKQPWSYNLQKWIISNSFLTRNCKVLVYGKWENQSKNIIPFFTASYSEKEKKILLEKKTDRKIKLIFVGTFSKGKQPLKSVKVAEELLNRGFNVKLNMYGNGEEFQETKKYIIEKKLSKKIILHGNQTREIIKKAYQESHFLIFISKSEGWPKVLAEAMFWSCLPISTKISCVPEMLGNGERGVLVSENVEEIVEKITLLINSPRVFAEKVRNASDWSQNYTLETFENAISKVL